MVDGLGMQVNSGLGEFLLLLGPQRGLSLAGIRGFSDKYFISKSPNPGQSGPLSSGRVPSGGIWSSWLARPGQAKARRTPGALVKISALTAQERAMAKIITSGALMNKGSETGTNR